MKNIIIALFGLTLMVGVHASAEDAAEVGKAVGMAITEAVKSEMAALDAMDCAIEDKACLSKELEERYRIDQWGRENFYSLEICGDYAKTATQECRQRLMGTLVFQIDMPNTKRLKEVMATHGWPQPPEFSKETLNAAWYIAQHAQVMSPEGRTKWDVELASSILPGIKKSVENGDLTPWHYAAMFDRAAMMSGGQQRYATQLSCKEGKAVFDDLEDAAKLDEYRAEIGMKAFDQAAYDKRCESEPA